MQTMEPRSKIIIVL